LVSAVLDLVRLEETESPGWVMGAKISKVEAARRKETLTKIYRIFRLVDSTSTHAFELMRKELAEVKSPKRFL
jgi:hypothetical protein